MANERLRVALERTDLSPEQLARHLDVDPKTVERWVTQGRVPYARHRHAVAQLVSESERYLWPDAVPPARLIETAESEILHVYPHRAVVPTDLWRRLLITAKSTIDILIFSGMFLVDGNPRVAHQLAQRAAKGARVRLAVGDPRSDAVALRGVEEGIDDALGGKIRSVLVAYEELREAPAAEVRLHGTTLYNSLYRFDDEMLVNSHVYGFPAAQAPVLHLRRLEHGMLFDTYAESFKKVWMSARPAWARAGGRTAARAG